LDVHIEKYAEKDRNSLMSYAKKAFDWLRGKQE
jgi:hypothetical protein